MVVAVNEARHHCVVGNVNLLRPIRQRHRRSGQSSQLKVRRLFRQSVSHQQSPLYSPLIRHQKAKSIAFNQLDGRFLAESIADESLSDNVNVVGKSNPALAYRFFELCPI